MDWIGTIPGLAFLLRIAASRCWAAFGVAARTPAGVVANVAAILLCLRGLRPWNARPGRGPGPPI